MFDTNKNNDKSVGGLGRYFYSIYDDKALGEKVNNLDGKKPEKEAVFIRRQFYSIFNDHVESKNLTK